MSRFNKNQRSVVQTPDTTNFEGAEAFSMSPENELITLALSSFLEDKFYETESAQRNRLLKLLDKVDPVFAAKVAVYSRRVFGMRTITHVMAGELARKLSGTGYARSFFEQIADRPDDMLEIASYYIEKYGLPLPNSMKRAFAGVIQNLDAYRLSKYKASSKSLNMIDLVRLTHAKGDLVGHLLYGTLEPPVTWEVLLSRAGSDTEKKADVWRQLVFENQLGYLALLRNLRNIAQQADKETVSKALSQLTDPTRVSRSRVFPFQVVNAYRTIQGRGNYWGETMFRDHDIPFRTDILNALDRATDLSLSNVPDIFENTLVAVDTSYSMNGKPRDIAATFGAALYKKGADLVEFATKAKWLRVPSTRSVLSIEEDISAAGGGTNFHSIFELLGDKKYNRIIILSDMQAWIESTWSTSVPAETSFREYRKKAGVSPTIYSWDLQGYGSLQVPESKTFLLAGWTDKVFDFMEALETDSNAMRHMIEERVSLRPNS